MNSDRTESRMYQTLIVSVTDNEYEFRSESDLNCLVTDINVDPKCIR